MNIHRKVCFEYLFEMFFVLIVCYVSFINISINFSGNKLQVLPEIDEDWLTSLSSSGSSSKSDLITKGMYVFLIVMYMYLKVCM